MKLLHIPDVYLFFLALQIADCAGLWWAVGKPFILDARRICRKARRLKGHQLQMCRKEYLLVREIVSGAQTGMMECQHQLRHHRWNCTTARRSLGKMLLRDTKESAFVQAITSSSVVHRVARACSSGQIASCGCADRFQSVGEHYKWGGCGANVNYGVRKSREFMDAQNSRYKDIRAVVLHHNNEVGRTALRTTMETKCRCHGMSGSCQMKTCWQSIRKFRKTGDQLFDKFENAKAVSPGNDGSSSLWANTSDDENKANGVQRRSIVEEELVYTDQSPDFCKRDRRFGVLGPKGRPCNVTQNSAGNCDYLCCGRGHKVLVERVETNCKCQFKWCCEVVCQKCVETVQMHNCK